MLIYNSRNPYHKSPFGAVKTKENVAFTVTLPLNYQKVVINVKGDDDFLVKKSMERIKTDNSNVFTTKIIFEDEGTYFYYFDLGVDNNGIYNNSKGEGVIRKDGALFQLTVFDKNFTTPDNFKGGVFYQIFPDRFNRNENTPYSNIKGRVYPKDKNSTPLFSNKDITTDYYGGNLQGIIDKLDYLKELNITSIYLNPIFESHSNHRYNTADFLKVDPDLGTLDDFLLLIKKAKEKDINVILDGVFSHVGSDSIYFNKENRYSSLGAFNSKFSPYYSWFDFDKKYDSGYRSWWGFNTLPEINEMDEGYLNFIFGKEGVLKYWLSKGIAGFRLDVADELPDEFLEKLRVCVKEEGDNNLIIGEVWEDASNKISFGKRRKYLLGNGLDSVMNYPFRNAILNFVKFKNPNEFSEEIMSIYENYPKPALDTTLNSLSTHDTVRAITFIGSKNPYLESRQEQSETFLSEDEYENAKQMLILAYALLFTLPGIPCVYYGDEIGMQGYKDPFNRMFFAWDNMDQDILNSIKTLSKIRAENRIFEKGLIHFIYSQNGCTAFVRYDDDNETLIIVNTSSDTQTINYNNILYEINPKDYLIEKL